jgi:hypothetical protein
MKQAEALYETPTLGFQLKKASLMKKSYNYGDSQTLLL